MTIKVTKTENKIKVSSPYHKVLPKKARQLGGDRIDNQWVFDLEDIEEVRDLYMDIYGEFEAPSKTLNIKVFLKEDLSAARDSVYLFGRQIARAYGRDSGAKTIDGIVLHDCTARSGGSVKNWRTDIDITGENPYIKIKNVSEIMFEKHKDEYEVEIISEKSESLTEEKERLLKRIKEIDKLLKEG